MDEYDRDAPGTTRLRSTATGSTTEGVAEATRSVASTAKEQGREVAGQVAAQARGVAGDMRRRVVDEAHTQNQRLASGLRQVADQLDEMAMNRADSPAGSIVHRLGEGGRRAADFLERQGPEGALREVQEFARRRPGIFLLGAALAGFAMGRLGKGLVGAGTGTGTATGDGGGVYRSRYAEATSGYPAAPGTPASARSQAGTGEDGPLAGGVSTPGAGYGAGTAGGYAEPRPTVDDGLRP
ncbi:MAG TPA: hypothetical protein VFM55_20100 [Micromonosporaceae bacterium]|nr:hypothetical protein [Micromonosporaceae bacterium]